MQFENLFTPFKIGKVTVANRLCTSPMVTNFGDKSNAPSEKSLPYYRERAKGGWGMITTEALHVTPSGNSFTAGLGLWDDAAIPRYAAITDTVHRYGDVKIFAQLNHSGRGALETGFPAEAPSAIPCPSNGEVSPLALSRQEIKDIVIAFGEAALRAKKSGLFDLDCGKI